MGLLRRLNHRRTVAILHDIVMAAASFVLSLYLRLGEDTWSYAGPFLWQGTVLFTMLAAAIFWSMRLYRGLWRYASVPDLVALTKAVSLVILCFLPLMFTLNRLEFMPRSVPVINWFILLALLGGPRFLYRMIKDRTIGFDFAAIRPGQIPVLLVGAGDNAELFMREMARHPDAPYRVVGLVDDDRQRIGGNIHNVRVYGDIASLAAVVRKLKRKGRAPQKILLAEDRTDSRVVRHALAVSDELGVPLSRLPKMTEFKSGADERLRLQPIAIEDLLGRPQQVHDRDAMRALVAGKRVLITGAGGTIGAELTRQVAGFAPSKCRNIISTSSTAKSPKRMAASLGAACSPMCATRRIWKPYSRRISPTSSFTRRRSSMCRWRSPIRWRRC